MKKMCLISFVLFRLSFGAGLIHERLSVRLSLFTNNMPKICLNISFTLKPTASFLSRSHPSASPPPTTPATSDHTQEPHRRLFLHDDLMGKREGFHIELTHLHHHGHGRSR